MISNTVVEFSKILYDVQPQLHGQCMPIWDGLVFFLCFLLLLILFILGNTIIL